MFDPYRKWLGIPPEEQPPNHYRLLGISLFENDLDVIKVAVMQRSAYVRNFQAGKQGDDAARILNEIAAAEDCLTNKAKRAPYDAELKRKEAAKKPRPAPAAPPAAPRIDPLLEQAAAMTTLSAPWQSPQFSQRQKQTNYLPLAIGGVAVVIVVVLGMVLASMLGGDGDENTVAQAEPQAPDASVGHSTTENTTPPTTSADDPPEVATTATTSAADDASAAEPESTEPAEVDLLALIDPARDSVQGAWRMENGALVSTGTPIDKLQIRLPLPEEYVLELDAVPQQAAEGMLLGIVVGGRQTCVLLGTYAGTVNGLGLLDGLNGNENSTVNNARVFAAGATSRFVVEVRRNSVKVTANGLEIVNWQGDPSRLSVHEDWAVPDKAALFLGDGGEVIRYTRFVLKPLADSAPPPSAIAPFNAAQARAHQEAWAAHLGVPVQYENSMGMKLILIPPGEFVMGSTPEEIEKALAFAGGEKFFEECIRSEAPQHKVILSQPIYVGAHEVTQAEYEQIMGRNPSHFAVTGPGKDSVADLDTSTHPVEQVSWIDAAEFCEKLSAKEHLSPLKLERPFGESVTSQKGIGYRLPTEAQWEFACRAGTTTRYWTGDRDDGLPLAGWIGPNSGGRTHAVGELKKNPFGIYDIHGNVSEWVQDGWEASYYKQFQGKPALNPSGPSSVGSRCMLRGGRCHDAALLCRVSTRYGHESTVRNDALGFRVALSVDAVAAFSNPPIAGLTTDQLASDSAADAQQEADPLAVVQDFSLATAQLAELENWTQRSGEWTAEGGRIVGKGEGMLEFKQHFPQDFLLEMTATVRAGTRMRIHLGGSDLYIGNEGANNNLWLHGTAHANLQGQPLVYQLNRPLKMAVKMHGPNLTFAVNGQSVASARRLKVDTVKLVLQPGDGFSPGDVEFRDFRLGPPPLSPDEAMAAIRAAGGSIEPYNHQGQPVLKVVMTGRGVTDEVVANVRWLPNTREIFLGGSNISDAGMAHLAGLQRLEVLGLDDTPISDAGVAHLVELPRLSILNVGWSSGRSAITDAGAEHLSKLTRLTSLGVSHTQLTDAGLKHLAKLTRLETLFLNGIALSNAAVAELKRMLPKANIVR